MQVGLGGKLGLSSLAIRLIESLQAELPADSALKKGSWPVFRDEKAGRPATNRGWPGGDRSGEFAAVVPLGKGGQNPLAQLLLDGGNVPIEESPEIVFFGEHAIGHD